MVLLEDGIYLWTYLLLLNIMFDENKMFLIYPWQYHMVPSRRGTIFSMFVAFVRAYNMSLNYKEEDVPYH